MTEEALRDIMSSGFRIFEDLTEEELLQWVAKAVHIQGFDDVDDLTKTLAAFAAFGALSVLTIMREKNK